MSVAVLGVLAGSSTTAIGDSIYLPQPDPECEAEQARLHRLELRAQKIEAAKSPAQRQREARAKERRRLECERICAKAITCDCDDDPPARPRGKNAPRESLDKFDIVAGMKNVWSAVGDCYAKYRVTGIAMVNVAIERNGTVVQRPIINGTFAGTPTGECVVEAVARAKFPRFACGPPHRVSYPFTLR